MFKKKKKTVETAVETPTPMMEATDKVVPGNTIPPPPTPPAMNKEDPKLTKQQKEMMEYMQNHLDYFNLSYGSVDFGDNFGGIKQMLFGIFCELRNIRQLNEEE